jgi:sulfur transfer protein SufE
MSLESLERAVQGFEGLSREARIGALIELAESLPRFAPLEGESWDVRDVRQDQECQDVLGLFARLEADTVGNTVRLAAQVGAESTTLTKALTALFVTHLNGESPRAILSLDQSIVPRVIGESLMRQRSSAAYYTLRRLKEAVEHLELAARR